MADRSHPTKIKHLEVGKTVKVCQSGVCHFGVPEPQFLQIGKPLRCSKPESLTFTGKTPTELWSNL